MKVIKAKSVEELPLLLSVMEAATVMGLARNKMYELVHRTDFPLIRLGKSMRIPRDLLLTWLEKQANNK